MEMSSKRLRARVERYLNFGHGPDGVITRNNYSQKKKKSGGLVGRDILNKLFNLNLETNTNIYLLTFLYTEFFLTNFKTFL